MKIACTMASVSGDTDLRLSEVADKLQTQGLKTCGTVQIKSARADSRHCDMDVRVLPDGPVVRISTVLTETSMFWSAALSCTHFASCGQQT